MLNPIDASGAPFGTVAICQDSTLPSEADLLRDETRAAANNKTMAYQAHNFAEESSNEEDDNDSIFCKATNSNPPLPAFLHNYVSVHDKLPCPFKLINSKKRAAKRQLGLTDSNIMASFYNYYFWLGTHGCCMNHLGSKKLSCDCLLLFDSNHDLVEAVATHGQKTLQRTASAIYFMAFIA